MQCNVCGSQLKLTHKRIIVDALQKEYHCKNGHLAICLRYGNSVEINGNQIKLDEFYKPPAYRPSP